MKPTVGERDKVGGVACKPRLLIVADDLGRDEYCTKAIVTALSENRISAASIMANGAYFEKACSLVHAHGLLGRIGVHIALDEGPALSREMRELSSDGHLHVSRSLLLASASMSAAIKSECVEQVRRVIKYGIQPTHLDSHRHIHTRFAVGRLVVRTAREFSIPYVRPARNLIQRSRTLNRAYKWGFNRYLRSQVRTADYFGDIADAVRNRYVLPVSAMVECMIHLDASPRGIECQELLRTRDFERFMEGYDLVHHPIGVPRMNRG